MPDRGGEDDTLMWSVRAHVYRALAESGASPSVDAIAQDLGRPRGLVTQALEGLAALRALALDPNTGEVWMAHPFSAVETRFVVTTSLRSYYANCDWDAISIPLLLGVDGFSTTRCPQSGAGIRLEVSHGRLLPVEGVIRYPVPVGRFWDDIGFT